MFTITQKKHDKTGEDIWVAKLNDKLTDSQFKEINEKIKENGGYYSKFVKGFVFKNDPTDFLKSLNIYNKIKGGLADNKTIDDIAKKHHVDLEYLKNQLEIGTDVEMEHTNDREKAKEIALDHLYESPFYYEELKKMEEKLKSETAISDTETAISDTETAISDTETANKHLILKIRMIIDINGTNKDSYSPAELQLIRQYPGMGGYATKVEKRTIDTGLLDQFYTPYPIIEKMWGLALKYGFVFDNSKILEPSCGIGRFLEYIPSGQDVYAYEIDKYAYTIAKISFTDFNILNEPFETMFFKGNRRLGISNVETDFDLVIGNPPYKEFISKYALIEDAAGQSEKSETLALTYDQYMLMRGVDVLKKNGLLVFIIPSSFLSNDKKYNNFKNLLATKADLIDAYRLTNNTFPNTQINTDIVVLKRK